jgi:hypothetical protein
VVAPFRSLELRAAAIAGRRRGIHSPKRIANVGRLHWLHAVEATHCRASTFGAAALCPASFPGSRGGFSGVTRRFFRASVQVSSQAPGIGCRHSGRWGNHRRDREPAASPRKSARAVLGESAKRMGPSIQSLLIPIALFYGEPVNAPHASYERGLFCDSVELVASIVEIADKGVPPRQAVSEVNRSVDRNACLYTDDVDVLAEVVKLERRIAANQTTYGIYRVSVSGFGQQRTEIGNVAWKFSQPLVMYTLRAAPAADTAEHEVAKPSR